MVGVGVENHVRIGVEMVIPADAPHVSTIQVGLGDAKDDEHWDQSHQFNHHQPSSALPGNSGPFAIEGAVGLARPLRAPFLLRHRFVAAISLLLLLMWCVLNF